jgi:uncharacterized protein (TIGR03503 family)
MNTSARPARATFHALLCALLTSISCALSAAPTAAAGGSSPHPDVRVLIDVSGSMKQNDPHNLRKPALELLLQLFPKDAKAGIWTFGESVAVLAPLQSVSESWRNAARTKSAQVTSDQLYTNIPAALEKATADIRQSTPGYRTSVILLTDGMVDISKSEAENAAARQRLLEQILPRLKQAGVIVQTIALSKSADRELMERIAADTGGLFATAESAEELNRIFLQALDAAAPAEQVPLSGNRFLVDSSIDELTTLVFNKSAKPVELVSPENKRYSAASHGDDIKWFQGQGFELVTITKPFEGEWQVVADVDKGSRVTIVSNLSLAATRLSESLFIGGAGNEQVAALKQQGEVVTQPEFLKLVKFTATVQRREDGKQWQLDLSAANPTPTDGYFKAPLPMLSEAGNYELAVTADGKTFQRSQKQVVTVRDNFDVRVAATDTLPPGHRVTLFAQNPAVDVAASTVQVSIKTDDGKVEQQPVGLSRDREWLLPLEAGKYKGHIEVTFEANGKYQGGAAFSYRSATVAIDEKGAAKIVAPAAKPAEPAAEVKEPAKAEEPAKSEPAAAEKTPEATPETEAEPAAEGGWKKWALYGGLVFGNILILALGYFAYRMIMGGGKSKVLEESEDEDDEGKGGDAKAAGGKKDEKKEKGADKDKKEEGKPKKKASLDLPDDAIDIDPASDKKK